MNPKHQIPCAQFKDGFLADSVVISKYLCKMNGLNLYPEDAMKQAKIDEAIIDVTEPNFKFRYFSRFDPLPSAGPSSDSATRVALAGPSPRAGRGGLSGG